MTDVITEAIPFDEPDCIKAMELYTAVAGKDTYDASATLDAFLSIRPYRAIMEDTGICQEIAGEYICYLLQGGINAIPSSAGLRWLRHRKPLSTYAVCVIVRTTEHFSAALSQRRSLTP